MNAHTMIKRSLHCLYLADKVKSSNITGALLSVSAGPPLQSTYLAGLRIILFKLLIRQDLDDLSASASASCLGQWHWCHGQEAINAVKKQDLKKNLVAKELVSTRVCTCNMGAYRPPPLAPRGRASQRYARFIIRNRRY